MGHGTAELGGSCVGVLENDTGGIGLSRRLGAAENSLAVGHERELEPWPGWAVGKVEFQTSCRVGMVGKVLWLTEIICERK